MLITTVISTVRPIVIPTDITLLLIIKFLLCLNLIDTILKNDIYDNLSL